MTTSAISRKPCATRRPRPRTRTARRSSPTRANCSPTSKARRCLRSSASDCGFALPPEDCHRVLAVLAYLADPVDFIPDTVPALGFLDDAIMIELCRNELRFEIEAYEDFSAWREEEA